MAAARALARAPSFMAVTVLTLAVGIGASTAVFSAVDTVLLRSLPYPEPEAVTSIGVRAIAPGDRRAFVDMLRVEPDLFEAVGSWRLHRATMTAPDEPERVRVVHAAEGLVDRVLGVQPSLGRAFLAEEHRADGARTVVLSRRFWEERMSGDPDALGRAIGLDGVPYTVVGVMPEGFRPPFNGRADLWIPAYPGDPPCNGDCEVSGVLGRLRAGTTLPAARARVAAIAGSVIGHDPSRQPGAESITVESLGDQLEGTAAATLWLLLLGVATASVLAFLNVAVLSVVRAAERGREFMIRRALGARRSDFARQLLVEVAILSSLGTLGAALFADWILESLSATAPPMLTAVDGIALDVPTLALTAGLGLISTAASVLTPLAIPMRAPVGGRSSAPPGRRWWVEWVMGGQVAIAVVLMVGAALLTRSLQAANHAELGFDPDGLVVLEVALPSGGLVDGPARVGLLEDVRSEILDVPGVVAAGGINGLPLSGSDERQRFVLDAESEDDRVVQLASLGRVTPGYFYTMGMRVLLGRTFDADDAVTAPGVAVVNERWARSFADFPRSTPVGRTIVQMVDGRPTPFTVVGVVSDVMQDGPRHPSDPTIYRAVAQDPPTRLALVVEVDDPSRRSRTLRRAVASVHPGLTVMVLGPMDDLLDQSLRSERFAARLSMLLATSMLLISLVGVYGTSRRAVLRRVRELGIRLSLGAGRADASRIALGPALRFVGTGVFVGLALSWAASPLLDRLLFGVSPHDTRSMLFAVSSAVVAGAVALWGPVRSAASVEPFEVLRE